MSRTALSDNFYSLSFLALSIALFVFWGQFYSISKRKRGILKRTTNNVSASNGSASIENESESFTTEKEGVKVRHPQVQFESKSCDEWLESQHQRTEAVLDQLKTRTAFKKKLKRAMRYESLDTPIHIGGRYFYSKRSGRRDQRESIYYWTTDVRSEGKVVFDPNTFFGDDSSNNILVNTWISDDGEMFAFAYLSAQGVDTATSVRVSVIDVSTALICPMDTISGLSINSLHIAWVENHAGFFYTRPVLLTEDITATTTAFKVKATPDDTQRDKTEEGSSKLPRKQQVCFHRLGTDSSTDIVIFEGGSPIETTKDPGEQQPQPQLYYTASVTADGHFLLIEAYADEDPYYQHSTADPAGNKLYMMDLTHFDGVHASTVGSCVNFVDSLAWRWEYVYNVDDNFWFRTNFGAPRFRIVRVSIRGRIAEVGMGSRSSDHHFSAVAVEENHRTSSRRGLGSSVIGRISDEQQSPPQSPPPLLEGDTSTGSEWAGTLTRGSTAAASQDSDMEDYSDDDNDSGFENGAGSPYFVANRSGASSKGAKLELLTSSREVAKGSGWRFLEVLSPPTARTAASDSDEVKDSHCRDADKNSESRDDENISKTTTVTLGAYGFIEWIPAHSGGAALESAAVAAFTVLVLKYIVQGTHEVILYDLSENLDKAARTPIATLPHPDCGSITGPTCFFLSNDVYYGFSSFSDPNSIYRAVIKRDLFARSTEISFDQVYGAVIRDYDSLDYDTVKVVCPLAKTRDASLSSQSLSPVSVPLYIFGSRQSLKKRSRPCILYVRDSFDVPPMPMFSPEVLVFVQHFDGLFCVADFSQVELESPVTATAAAARYNNQHHHQYRSSSGGGGCSNPNKKRTAQRAEDLTRVAKFLQEGSNPYCDRDMLSVLAESSGSITAAGSINRKSELFAAAVIECGMFDLMRYQYIHSGVSSPIRPLVATKEEATLAAAAAATSNASSSSTPSAAAPVISAASSQITPPAPPSSSSESSPPLPSEQRRKRFHTDTSSSSSGTVAYFMNNNTDTTALTPLSTKSYSSSDAAADNITEEVEGGGGNIIIDRNVEYGSGDGLRHRTWHVTSGGSGGGGGGGREGRTSAAAAVDVSAAGTTVVEKKEEEQEDGGEGVVTGHPLKVVAARSSYDEDPLDRIFPTVTVLASPSRSHTDNTTSTRPRHRSSSSSITHSDQHRNRQDHDHDQTATPSSSSGTLPAAAAAAAAPTGISIVVPGDTSRLLPAPATTTTESADSSKSEYPAEWKTNPWYSELGYAEESVEDTNRLQELSPLHGIEKSDPMDPYPAMLLITWDDAQVSPIHSYKYVAELQEVLAPRPIQVGRMPPLLWRDGGLNDHEDNDSDEESESEDEADFGPNWINDSDKSLTRVATKICFLAEHIGATWHD